MLSITTGQHFWPNADKGHALGASRISSTMSPSGPGTVPMLPLGLLYLGVGALWFLPLRYVVILRYLNMAPYIQFDIPQAAFHFLNLSVYLHLRWPYI